MSTNAPAASSIIEKEGSDGDWLTLDAAMTRHIESALRRTRGRIEGADGAAALLAINPHTLRARMRKLGINWKRFRITPK
jgi:transcriptional regulator with GAF, ATPase, and Fis domain